MAAILGIMRVEDGDHFHGAVRSVELFIHADATLGQLVKWSQSR